MIRFYIMPTVGDATPESIRMPKYGGDFRGMRIRYFGFEDLCLFSAEVTTEEHDALIANADVRALPEDLDAQVGVGGANVIETYLENHKMPGDWVQPTMTYRTVVKNVVRLMKALEFFEAFAPRTKILAALQLTNTVSDLSQNNQDKLAQAAGLVGVTFQTTDTLRQVLKDIALAATDEQIRFDIVRL